MKWIKKINSRIIMFLFAVAILITVQSVYVRASGNYTADWQRWSQGASGYSAMEYGCRVTAYAKMLAEAGYTGFRNPDGFFEWGKGRGYFRASDTCEMTSIGVAPVTYVNENGGTASLVGRQSLSGNKTADANTIMSLINQGYYVVLTCSSHTAYVGREASISQGTAVLLDSWSSRVEGPSLQYRSYTLYTFQTANYFRISSNFTNNNPIGSLDGAEGGMNTVRVSGWAFDPDAVSQSIDVHIYIGGPVGVGEGHAITANACREDVNSVYGVGIYHGFDLTLRTSCVGTQTVYMYAINIGDGTNPLIGTKTVNISSDTTAPAITEVHVVDVSREGYTVICKVEDAGGVTRVQFPTWTLYNDQDDLAADWGDNSSCGGTQNGTMWSYRVNVGDHNGEEGWYRTHIYAWDTAGNSNSAGIDTYIDWTPPTISEIQVTNINSKGYTITCKVEDAMSDIAKVQFPTWTIANDQDDLAESWGENPVCSGTQSGVLWSYRVNINDHNNESGFYRTHIYAWDTAGNRSDALELADIYIDGTKHEDNDKPGDTEKLSVGTVHIDAEEGTVHYYCDVSAAESGISIANVNITTDTGISRDYTRPIKDGKVDGYLNWLDFQQGMDAIYTITVSVRDASGNIESNTSSIDAKAKVSITPSSATLNVGESFQFSLLEQGVLCLEEEKWSVAWEDRDKGALTISENGLVTALLPGEYRIECSTVHTQKNVMTDDWDENMPFLDPARSKLSWLSAKVTVKLPAPDIQNITTDKDGTVNLSIRESAGAESYEIAMKQIVNGNEGDEALQMLKAGETAQTFTGLKDGSVWSYKVRAYCTVEEETYYSDWSAETTIKVGANEESSSDTNIINPGPEKPSGSSEVENKIINYTPTKTSISGKLTAKSKGFTVKWKKQKSITGYQIQYSTNRKFTKKTTKIKTIKKASTTRLTVKKLKANKKYYVRVRTYRVVKGKKYYSSWSKSKTVRTKR